MTREDLKRKVLEMVNVKPELSARDEQILDDRLKGYREDFSFGPESVAATERELRRQLSFGVRPTTQLRGKPKRS